MRGCEVAVIGLGVVGSAALDALTRRGADALGFDPLAVGAPGGSSHGSCRIFRRFNFESPAYTQLSDQAYAAWRALEAQTGRAVLIPSPVLEAGPSGSAMVAASRAAAAGAGGYDGPLKAPELRALFPAFRLPDDWDVAVHEAAGILLAEEAVRLFRAAAPDRIVPEAARFAGGPGPIAITTASGDQYQAERLILAAGPWVVSLLPRLAAHVTVTRQAVGWFEAAAPRQTGLGDFPLFILEAPRGLVYGFPDFEGRGVKAALHDHGPPVGADDWGPAPSDAELAPVSQTLATFAPGAHGRIVERDVCLYTNTGPGDADGSAAEEFILDRLPEDPRIIVASPCSGHGFKFASAIGEILARLAVDDAASADPAFRLGRFSSFAR
jgi:sarcosine oxidase